MKSIDLEKAQSILDDLRLQLKQTHEQFVLLTGAVQGAEAVLNLAAEPEMVKETPRGKK